MSVEVAHAHELLRLAEEAARHAYAQDAAAWTRKLGAKANELASAVAAFEDAGDEISALRLIASLRVYSQDSGRVAEVRALADDLVARVERSSPSQALAAAQLVSGELAFRQGDQVSALQATEAARSTAAAVGDRLTEGRAEINLARVAFRDGDAVRISAHAEKAFALTDDPRVQSGALHMLGWAAYTAGDVAGAMTRFQETANQYAQRGDLVGLAGELTNLGDLALEQGDISRAARYLREALDVAVETNSRYLIPGVLASVAALAAVARRYPEALELAAAADREYEEAGLTPDPGDDFSVELREAAVAAVGEVLARELSQEGRQRSHDEVLALARLILSADQHS